MHISHAFKWSHEHNAHVPVKVCSHVIIMQLLGLACACAGRVIVLIDHRLCQSVTAREGTRGTRRAELRYLQKALDMGNKKCRILTKLSV